jgi:hypothetical protein
MKGSCGHFFTADIQNITHMNALGLKCVCGCFGNQHYWLEANQSRPYKVSFLLTTSDLLPLKHTRLGQRYVPSQQASRTSKCPRNSSRISVCISFSEKRNEYDSSSPYVQVSQTANGIHTSKKLFIKQQLQCLSRHPPFSHSARLSKYAKKGSKPIWAGIFVGIFLILQRR